MMSSSCSKSDSGSSSSYDSKSENNREWKPESEIEFYNDLFTNIIDDIVESCESESDKMFFTLLKVKCIVETKTNKGKDYSKTKDFVEKWINRSVSTSASAVDIDNNDNHINNEKNEDEIIAEKIAKIAADGKICDICNELHKVDLLNLPDKKIEEPLFTHYVLVHGILYDRNNFLDAPPKVFEQMKNFINSEQMENSYLEIYTSKFHTMRELTRPIRSIDTMKNVLNDQSYHINCCEMTKFFTYIARNGDVKFAKDMLSFFNENVLEKDLDPLLHATEKGHTYMIQFLINRVIDFDEIDDNDKDNYEKCVSIMENVFCYCKVEIIDIVLPNIYKIIGSRGIRFVDKFLIRMKGTISDERYKCILKQYATIQRKYALF